MPWIRCCGGRTSYDVRRARAGRAGVVTSALRARAGALLVAARRGVPRVRAEDATRMMDYCARLRAQFASAFQESAAGAQA